MAIVIGTSMLGADLEKPIKQPKKYSLYGLLARVPWLSRVLSYAMLLRNRTEQNHESQTMKVPLKHTLGSNMQESFHFNATTLGRFLE